MINQHKNEWNYSSPVKQSTGYEDVLDILKSYTKEKYMSCSDVEKEKMINDIFQIYRSKNIYPINYYNEEGVREEIKKCMNKKVKPIMDNVIQNNSNEGTSLCKFMNPNFIHVTNGSDKRSFYYKFHTDEILKRAIRTSIKHKNNVVPYILRDTLNIVSGATFSNFKPMTAKSIYEKYCPENGLIYDFSCGWGGRMLGALTSEKNYTYVGVEPNTNTYNNLNKLGDHINSVSKKRFKIYKACSEDFSLKSNIFDFAFSSPPYFNLEIYSDEDTQCYNKYSNISDWMQFYVKPTILNTYKMLKPNSYYAVNIANFKTGKTSVSFVDEWLNFASEIGFKYIERVNMKLPLRCGDGHDKSNNINQDKKEGVYVFRK